VSAGNASYRPRCFSQLAAERRDYQSLQVRGQGTDDNTNQTAPTGNRTTVITKNVAAVEKKIRVAKDTTILVFKMPKIAVDVRFEIIVSAPKFNSFAPSLIGCTFIA
jgi:hypothetical protein